MVSCISVRADCYGVIALPLSMSGKQTQLLWSGTIGGNGSGTTNSTCEKASGYKYDFRYNIVEQEATCVSSTDSTEYKIPVTTTGATITSGAMSKLAVKQGDGGSFDVWGRLFTSPASKLPVGNKGISGTYKTTAEIDVSSLPAGTYSCQVRNTHMAYGTDDNDVEKGVDDIFNYALSVYGWATGTVNVTINSACSIPDSLNIDHGAVMAGGTDVKEEKLSVICNRSNTVTVSLKGTVDSDGLIVNLGSSGSQSKLSILDGPGGSSHTTVSKDVESNISTDIYIRSVLTAKGNGMQEGNAVLQVTYN